MVGKPIKRILPWRSSPKPIPYALRKWHPSELNSKYNKLQNQIYEQVVRENNKSGHAVSGYFTYKITGTKNRIKELSLSLQGIEENHDKDVKKFIAMSNRLSISATGFALTNEVKQLILDEKSKSQNKIHGYYFIDDLGHGYNFCNYNAASARETWARQYLLRIDAPDRTLMRVKRLTEFEELGKVYSGAFHPSEWGLG